MNTFIPWAKPDYWGNEIRYVNEALESNWISGGSFLDRLEKAFADLFQQKYVLAVSNGTTAIHLAYLGLNLNAGDEIIVPGFGFLAAANIALHLHLKPVFAEVNPETWCLDSEDVIRKITPKTKAIVPVHTYGNVCDMRALMDISCQYQIPLIEDTAEAIFSKFNQQYAGTFGEINTFSFQATKTITTGEGGLVVTQNEEIHQRMCLYRSHGMTRGKTYYFHELPGHNFRLTNFQAAMGVAQLEKIEMILQERQRCWNTYHSLLADKEGVTLQKIEDEVEPAMWAIGILLDAKAFPQGRDAVIQAMKEHQIETRPGFYASSMLNIYETHTLPICEEVSRQIISLPFFPSLTDAEIERICMEFLKLKK